MSPALNLKIENYMPKAKEYNIKRMHEEEVKIMYLTKSISFLLENAGAVIQYRLRKEILRDITQTEEENLLEQIYQTPNFKLVESYVKPNGYIGSGAHSWGKWRGVIYQPTYLADGKHVRGFYQTMLCRKRIR